jgi:hypothetical protein
VPSQATIAHRLLLPLRGWDQLGRVKGKEQHVVVSNGESGIHALVAAEGLQLSTRLMHECCIRRRLRLCGRHMSWTHCRVSSRAGRQCRGQLHTRPHLSSLLLQRQKPSSLRAAAVVAMMVAYRQTSAGHAWICRVCQTRKCAIEQRAQDVPLLLLHPNEGPSSTHQACRCCRARPCCKHLPGLMICW